MFTFTAIPRINMDYYGYNFKKDQKYSFSTDSFVNYEVKNKETNENFIIGDIDLFSTFETVDIDDNKNQTFLDFDWDIIPNMNVIEASDETVCAALMEYEIEFKNHPFKDIAIERGFIRRVSEGEESTDFLNEAEFEMLDDETCVINFGMGYEWGKYISDKDLNFYYSAVYYIKSSILLVKRIYKAGEQLSSFTENGYNSIIEKVKAIIQDNK